MLTATVPCLQEPSVFLTAGWHNLAMLNFVIDPEILLPRLPAGTELDYWQGQAFVSVVGFQFLDSKVLGVPLFFHRRFEEVNLRFYVVRPMPDGPRRGVVFLREIAPKRLIAWAARWFYNEKYVTMPMRHRLEMPSGGLTGRVEYEWRNGARWNGLSLRVHGDAQPLLPGSQEEFIAEHYFGYTRQNDGSTIEYGVEHPPWRAHAATLERFDCDVAAIYGSEFEPFLREPASVFVADGSAVTVRRGRVLTTDEHG